MRPEIEKPEIQNQRVEQTAQAQTQQNAQVDRYGSCFGRPRGNGTGFWIGLEQNRPGFAVQTRIACRLPVPIANTTWDHLGVPGRSLGAHRITAEQSGIKNIIFGNAPSAPQNHSYYLSFNDIFNSCIQFVFSSMYLCIYESI